MSRRIEDLRPEIRPMVEAMLEDCQAAGIDAFLTCTLRSNEEQAILYAQGRSTPGGIVTNAKPGQSAHNYGLAADVAILANGKLDWDRASPLWQQVGKFGQARGLVWYGAPDAKFSELPHFELPDWRTLV